MWIEQEPVAPPPRLRAPWDTHDHVDPPPFAVRFVGEEVWAQTHGCVWRFGRGREPRLLRVTSQLQLTRAVGRWVELRSAEGWTRSFGLLDSADGVYLYDARADAWYTGPWPDGLGFWIRQAIEPEDFVLHEPLRGWSLDVARWDRHRPMLFGAHGEHALIDDQIVDLRTGAVRPDPVPRATEVEDLFPERPLVLGPPGVSVTWRRSLDALTIAGTTTWRTFEAGDGHEPFGVLARDDHPVALLASSVQAAGFDAHGEHLALVTERSVQLYALADLAAPLWHFELPWPWCDPFAAATRHGNRPELAGRWRFYLDHYGPWLDADIEQRERFAPTRAAPIDSGWGGSERAEDDDIPF